MNFKKCTHCRTAMKMNAYHSLFAQSNASLCSETCTKACVAQMRSSKYAIQMHDPSTHNKLERSLQVSLHNLLFLFNVFDASSETSIGHLEERDLSVVCFEIPLLCEQTAKAQASLRGCAGSPEPSLFAYVISTFFHVSADILNQSKYI